MIRCCRRVRPSMRRRTSAAPAKGRPPAPRPRLPRINRSTHDEPSIRSIRRGLRPPRAPAALADGSRHSGDAVHRGGHGGVRLRAAPVADADPQAAGRGIAGASVHPPGRAAVPGGAGPARRHAGLAAARRPCFACTAVRADVRHAADRLGDGVGRRLSRHRGRLAAAADRARRRGAVRLAARRAPLSCVPVVRHGAGAPGRRPVPWLDTARRGAGIDDARPVTARGARGAERGWVACPGRPCGTLVKALCSPVCRNPGRRRPAPTKEIPTLADSESRPVAGMPAQDVTTPTGLRRTLAARHLTMIAVGGSLGTGLVVASGNTIAQAGPGGALLGYAMIGLMVYFLMTSLGELAAAMPVAGSFATYGARYVEPGFGFALGWNYWYNWAVTVAVDLVAAQLVMAYWFPDVPGVYWSALFLALTFGLNALSARGFGEAGFWFALIKVVAVLVFIAMGVLMLLGIIRGGETGGWHNWTVGDAPFAGGFAALIGVAMVVGFSCQGTEL